MARGKSKGGGGAAKAIEPPVLPRASSGSVSELVVVPDAASAAGGVAAAQAKDSANVDDIPLAVLAEREAEKAAKDAADAAAGVYKLAPPPPAPKKKGKGGCFGNSAVEGGGEEKEKKEKEKAPSKDKGGDAKEEEKPKTPEELQAELMAEDQKAKAEKLAKEKEKGKKGGCCSAEAALTPEEAEALAKEIEAKEAEEKEAKKLADEEKRLEDEEREKKEMEDDEADEVDKYPPVPTLEDLIRGRDKPSLRRKGERKDEDKEGEEGEEGAEAKEGKEGEDGEAKEGEEGKEGKKAEAKKKGGLAGLAGSLCCFGSSAASKKESSDQDSADKDSADAAAAGDKPEGDAAAADAAAAEEKEKEAGGGGGIFGCCFGGGSKKPKEGDEEDGETKEEGEGEGEDGEKKEGEEGEEGKEGAEAKEGEEPKEKGCLAKLLPCVPCLPGNRGKKKEEDEKPLSPEEEKRLEQCKPVPTLKDLVLGKRKPTKRPYTKPKDPRPLWQRAKKKAVDALTPTPELIRTVVIGTGMFNYCDNYLSTAKYTMLNFFPKCIFEQLRRLGNLYFVVISALMVVGTYTDYFDSPLKPYSVLLPLIVVLAVSMVQEGIADSRRHNGDEDINTQMAVTANGPHEFMCWQDIRVGNMIVVRNGEPLPADLAIIASSEEEGLCYVETSQLDGESSLKMHRAILWSTNGKPDLNEIKAACADFEGVIECEAPNLNLNSFNGRLCMEGKDPMPIDQENFLVRGATLMNTKWVIGVACYTGHETKIAKNGRRPPSKLTRIDRAINTAALTILATDLLLVTASAAMLWWFERESLDKLPYLGYYVEGYTDSQYMDRYGSDMEWSSDDTIFWKGWLTFLILYNNFVPISMYVTIEVVTFFMIFFLNNDQEMYHEKTNTRAKSRSSNITDLGQIHYVFTDKTGTLTENEMIFKRASVAGVVYGKPVDATAVARTRLLAAGQNPVHAAAIAAAAKAEARRRRRAEAAALKAAGGGKGKKGGKRSKRKAARAAKKAAKKANEFHQPKNIVSIDNRTMFERRKTRALARKQAARAAAVAAVEEGPLPVVDDYLEMQALSDAASATDESRWEEAATSARIFLEVLAAANTVMTEDTPKGRVYLAESPDERALVEAAAEMGHALTSRSRKGVTITVHGEERTYEVLGVNSFDSDRKRMSIVVRGADGVVTLLCKGADSIMLALARDPLAPHMAATRQHLEEFASEGLRTLVLGVRTLTDTEFSEWERRRRGADEDPEADKEAMYKAAAAEIEKNLEILGATAIEDRLQEGVPDTMAALAEAGIKTWVLTGDKRETAINIGYASKVLEPEMRLHILRDSDRRTVLMALAQMYKKLAHVPVRNPGRLTRWFRPKRTKVLKILLAAQKVMEEYCQYEYKDPQEDVYGPIDKTSDKPAFVVEGTALVHILGTPGLEAMVLGVASKCQAVIACRVSPKQKSVLVKMVQKYVHPKPVTLAIGDGANDVPMLRQAQVGIGISGQEGRQAVNSADFSIARFCYLKRLLLVHGRWNYRRLCKVVLYSFLKNLVLIVTLFCYSFYTGFSGTALYNDAFFAMFNFILGLPIVGVGIFDRDISAEYAMSNPQVYAPGRDNTDLNFNVIVRYIVYGLLCGAVLFFGPMFLFASSGASDLWGLAAFGSVVATILIIAMTYKVLMEHRSIVYSGRGGCLTCDFRQDAQEYWSFASSFGWSVFFIVFSLVLYFFTTIAYSTMLEWDWQWYWSGLVALDSPMLWLLVVLIPTSLILVDVAWNYISNYLFPGPMNISAEQDYAAHMAARGDAKKPKREEKKKKKQEKAGKREMELKAELRKRKAAKEKRHRELMEAAVAKGMLSPSALLKLPPAPEDGEWTENENGLPEGEYSQSLGDSFGQSQSMSLPSGEYETLAEALANADEEVDGNGEGAGATIESRIAQLLNVGPAAVNGDGVATTLNSPEHTPPAAATSSAAAARNSGGFNRGNGNFNNRNGNLNNRNNTKNSAAVVSSDSEVISPLHVPLEQQSPQGLPIATGPPSGMPPQERAALGATMNIGQRRQRENSSESYGGGASVASRGGSVGSRGGSVASRGNASVASRGNVSVVSRAGSMASRAASVFTRGSTGAAARNGGARGGTVMSQPRGTAPTRGGGPGSVVSTGTRRAALQLEEDDDLDDESESGEESEEGSGEESDGSDSGGDDSEGSDSGGDDAVIPPRAGGGRSVASVGGRSAVSMGARSAISTGAPSAARVNRHPTGDSLV